MEKSKPFNGPLAGAVEVNGRKHPIPALTLRNWERMAAALANALAGKHELPRVIAGMTTVVCIGIPRLSWCGRWPKKELRQLPPEELQRVFEAVLDAWKLGTRDEAGHPPHSQAASPQEE